MATAEAGLPPFTEISTLSIAPFVFLSSGEQDCEQFIFLSKGRCLTTLERSLDQKFKFCLHLLTLKSRPLFSTNSEVAVTVLFID